MDPLPTWLSKSNIDILAPECHQPVQSIYQDWIRPDAVQASHHHSVTKEGNFRQG